MLRALGAALIIAATGSMGLRGVLALRKRTAVLAGLIASLQIMESEICSRMAPMREVLEQLTREAPPPVRGLYRRAYGGLEALGRCSFFTVWKMAVEKSRELDLRPEEEQTLTDLGLSLGRYDVREQAEAIGRAERRLEAALAKAEEERARDSKLHAFFGIASGIFAVIILL